MNEITQKIILFEYARPVSRDKMLNAEPGIWEWTLAPGVVNVTDDNGHTDHYEYNNASKYNILSLKVDDLDFSKVTSLADCRSTEASFYYDTSTTKIYIHFVNSEPPLGKDVYFGAAVGFSYRLNQKYYFNDIYYAPLISKIFSLKKSIDPLFWGNLSYQSGKVDFIGTGRYFDNWRSLNLFNQAARILIGNDGDTYENFKTIFAGFIENDNRTWETFSVNVQDPRKGLTQPVARNTLKRADWPYIADSNIDKSKPVAYGPIRNQEAICLNESEEEIIAIAPASYTFLICDTEFHNVLSLDAVRVAGVDISPVPDPSLSAGTFALTAAQCQDADGNLQLTEVRIDYHATSIQNGVSIIKDLMLNYDGKTFIESFWDTGEVALAEATSRNTSVYVNEKSKKLSDVIQQICIDIDARFFTHDDGRYTLRLYDENRTPVKTIQCDEWMGEPQISNNGSEYLTSVIIGYNPDVAAGTYLTYENTSYEADTFYIYKKLKNTQINTNLPTLADAIEKSETIMNISKIVQDLITRPTKWQNSDLEPGDFIIASPVTRKSEAPQWGVYEVVGVEKDPDPIKLDVKLSMRFVKSYTPVIIDYGVIVDSDGNYIVDSDGIPIMGAA